MTGMKGSLKSEGQSPKLKSSARQLLFEVADDLPDVGIHFHAVFDEAAGVENRAVVAPAKGFTNGVERAFGHLTREIHGDLARKGDILGATFAGHVGEANVEVFGDFLLNDFNADGMTAFLVQNLAEQAFNDFEAQFLAREGGVGGHANQRAFQAADVAANAVREKTHDFIRSEERRV